MSKNLHNIANNIDPDSATVLTSVDLIANEYGFKYLVVGAMARDMVMHYVYNAPVQRATQDIDLAIQLDDWEAYEQLRQGLLDAGYEKDKRIHRLINCNGIPIDIVPFGGIGDSAGNITWPPEHDFKMNILGFEEALDHADRVCIQGEPEVTVPVVSPIGFVLLKVLSWLDREVDMRTKDAKDLAYMFQFYEAIPAVQDGLYSNQELMEAYGFNQKLASIDLLGQQVARIAQPESLKVVSDFLNDQAKVEMLLEEMGDGSDVDYQNNQQRLAVFAKGLLNTFAE